MHDPAQLNNTLSLPTSSETEAHRLKNRDESVSLLLLLLLPHSPSHPRFSRPFSPFLSVATQPNPLRRRLLPRPHHLPHPATALFPLTLAAKLLLLRHRTRPLRLPDQVPRTLHQHYRFFLLPLLLHHHRLPFLPLRRRLRLLDRLKRRFFHLLQRLLGSPRPGSRPARLLRSRRVRYSFRPESRRYQR